MLNIFIIAAEKQYIVIVSVTLGIRLVLFPFPVRIHGHGNAAKMQNQMLNIFIIVVE